VNENVLSQSAALEQALAEVNSQITRLTTENQELSQVIEGYERRVENAPARAPQFEGFVRDYNSTRDQYADLQRRHDEALLAERTEQNREMQEFRVLDSAVPPMAPTGPARPLWSALGLVLAIVAGLAVAFIADSRDTSFHSIDDLREFTRVPVLASIPEIMATRVGLASRARTAAVAGAGVLGLMVLGGAAFLIAGASESVVRVLSRVT